MFEVGQIVIGQNFKSSPERNGMEAEITGTLQNRASRHVHTGVITTAMRYELKWADGKEWAQEPHHLRKKKPPKEIDWVKMCNLKVLEAV